MFIRHEIKLNRAVSFLSLMLLALAVACNGQEEITATAVPTPPAATAMSATPTAAPAATIAAPAATKLPTELSPTPVILPGAAKVAFSSNRNARFEIYVMNPDGSEPIRLTNHPEVDT